MKTNNYGFATLEIALFLFLITLISGTGWFVWHAKGSANKSLTNASNASYTAKLTAKPKPAATAPATPAPVTDTAAPSSPAATSARKPTIISSPAPVAPKPTPTVLTPSLTISADGCIITANGSEGFNLATSVHNSAKGGDSSEYLPASATLTIMSGGIMGMTVDAVLKDTSGNTLIQKSGTISADHCW